MSFEGYFQILCEAGHLDNVDVYDDDVAFLQYPNLGLPNNFKCSSCSGRAVWYSVVDETNCEYDDDGLAPGEVRLVVDVHGVGDKETTYKVPDGVGTRL